MKQIHDKHLSHEETRWLFYIQVVMVGRGNDSKKD